MGRGGIMRHYRYLERCPLSHSPGGCFACDGTGWNLHEERLLSTKELRKALKYVEKRELENMNTKRINVQICGMTMAKTKKARLS